MRAFLFMVPLAFLVPQVQAADAEGRFSVKGAGISTCQRYLEEWEAKSDAVYAFGGWVEGYLTAANQFLPETYDLAPWETTTLLTALLAEHCKKEPQIPFVQAVRSMTAALRNERLEQSSPVIMAEHAGSGVRVYREVLRRAQERLKALDLYRGPVNGEFGADTRAALETFQKSEGLTVTGLPDQPSLQKLLRPAR